MASNSSRHVHTIVEATKSPQGRHYANGIRPFSEAERPNASAHCGVVTAVEYLVFPEDR